MLLKATKYFIVSKSFDGLTFYLDELRPETLEFRELFSYTTTAFNDCSIYNLLNTIIISTFNSGTIVHSYISYDRGETWALYSPGYQFYCYSLITNDLWYACTTSQCYYSTDQGSSWAPIGNPFTGSPAIRPMAMFPFFIVPTYQLAIAHSNANFYTTNDFISWSTIPTGLSSINSTFSTNKIYAADSSSYFCYSSDYGSTFSVPYQITPFGLFSSMSWSEFSNNILVSCNNKAFVSFDNGISFLNPITGFDFAMNSTLLFSDTIFLSINTLNFYIFAHDNYGLSYSPYLFSNFRSCYPLKFLFIKSDSNTPFDSTITDSVTLNSIITPEENQLSDPKGVHDV